MRVVLVLLVIARVASADEVDDLVAHGEDLAKQGEWSRAIDAFKAADAKRPRATHACLIGLAYTRRESWAEAELFLSICRQRATASDPAPDWLDDAQHTLADKLAAANAAPIAIQVEPADAPARVTVSSFAPDESFAPRIIHLAPGTHVVTVEAPGYFPAKQEVTVATSSPQSLVLHLRRVPPPPTPFVRRLPYYVMAAGGAIAAGAIAYDVFELGPARDALSHASTNGMYDELVPRYETRRDVTIALYAGAAVTVAGGVVLRFVLPHEPVRVGAIATPHGAMIGLEWSR